MSAAEKNALCSTDSEVTKALLNGSILNAKSRERRQDVSHSAVKQAVCSTCRCCSYLPNLDFFLHQSKYAVITVVYKRAPWVKFVLLSCAALVVSVRKLMLNVTI